ncbi:MAG: FtsH protease activity modulator HflK [Desulfobacterota bacterium]|nr:FtsH protease activity modulator HflK [Thermodesulfobacteriota bacterium]
MPFGNDNIRGGPWKRQEPPDIEAAIQNMKRFFTGRGFSGLLIAGLVVAGLLLLSCFYSIQAGEVGVVQRFGRFVRIATPGLNFKLPAGIEKVTRVREQYVYTEEFGIRTIMPGERTQYAPERQFLDESLMLTGDLNCAVVPWIVQYRISDPYKYLFRVNKVQLTLRDLSEAIMRQVVGDRSINEVITERLEIAVEAKRLLQEALNDADTGITVVNLELKKTTVPEPVQPSFNEVNQAMQEKEKMIYQAREAYNKVIPEALGEAERAVKDAEGYALERINRASGDANRFMALWQEYSKAKDVTRRRLYLEAMGEVLPKLGTKYIIDADQRSLLPLLNLTQPQGGKKE